MFPSSRYRRNEQPAIGGNTMRVRQGNGSAYPELHYARMQNFAAIKRAGNLYCHWRKYTPEFNIVPYCPLCYNPRTHSPVDENCPECFGVGFQGGYATPSIQYMIARESDRRLEATDGGFVRLLRNMSNSPFLPNIATGDIIGEVQNYEGKFQIANRFLVEENVEKKRFRLQDDFTEIETYDHLQPENEVVAYKFEMTRIPRHAEEAKRRIEYFVPFENPVWLTTLDQH